MSQTKGKVAFEMRKREVELARLLPTKLVKNAQNLRRYRAIVASIPEIGLIEPLMVYPQGAGSENWLVLDGHLRLMALKQLGKTTAEVIVASEDERFTYNARVNRLPPIQAHKMIVKAVRNGVKPKRLSAALFIRNTKGESDGRMRYKEKGRVTSPAFSHTGHMRTECQIQGKNNRPLISR